MAEPVSAFQKDITNWQDQQKLWQDEVTRRQTEVTAAAAQATKGFMGVGVQPKRVGGLTIGSPFRTGLQMEQEQYKVRNLLGEDFVNTADYTARYQMEQTLYKSAFKNMSKAEWYGAFYSSVENLVRTGEVSSLEDWMTIAGSSPEGILDPEDYTTAEKVIADLKVRVSQPPQMPEALVGLQEPLTPEEEAVVKFLTVEPVVAATTIQRVTVDSILRALTGGQPPPQLPAGTSIESFLGVAANMGISEEQAMSKLEFGDAMAEYRAAWSEHETMRKEALSGINPYEVPEIEGFWPKVMFTVSQPMTVVADIMQPYIENVSNQWQGFIWINASRLLAGTQDMEKNYQELRSSGELNTWKAMGRAWEEGEAPWGLKLASEIFLDPLTYIPGLAFSVPGRLTVKVGTALTARGALKLGRGLTYLGKGALAFNKGLWVATDIPFNAFKAGWKSILKATSQVITREFELFGSAAITVPLSYVKRFKGVAKLPSQLTVEDMAETMQFCIKRAKELPLTEGDVYADFGRYLMEFKALEPADITRWAKSLDGLITPEDVNHAVVDEVNNILADVVHSGGNVGQNAKRMAMVLGVDDTPAVHKQIVKQILGYTENYTNRVDRIISLGRNTKLNPVAKMYDTLMSTQRKLITDFASSTYFRSRYMSGVMSALVGKIDLLDHVIWRRGIDRWAVRPIAEANLGNPAYPLWNAFESQFLSALEGVIPRQQSLESFLTAVGDLQGVDYRLLTGGASDIQGMLNGMPGRSGAISYLPGKIPEKIFGKMLPKWLGGKDYLEWTGRKWIEYSDLWGNAYRRNFVWSKYDQFLASYSKGVQLGAKDLNQVFDDVIGKIPKVSRDIGITDEVLRKEAFRRLQAALGAEDLPTAKAIIQDMKSMVNNTELMRKEQLKILNQATELSPQARTLGENAIARGEVITSGTEDTIKQFASNLADQSIADLKAVAQQADSFKWMADGIEETVINTPDDLMQIFRHYEVMTETAGGLPHFYLSDVFDQADELIKANKFNQMDDLWRKSRADLGQIIDNIDLQLERVRSKVQAHASLLPQEQADAMLDIIEKGTKLDVIKKSSLELDRNMLDDFWALPKSARTPEAHQALRVDRDLLWDTFRQEKAVVTGNDFWARRNYANLYNKMPAEKLNPVDASARALSRQDVANVMGCNIDNLTTGLTENLVMQDKHSFIQVVLKGSERRPDLFKGFTVEKIGDVYDSIVRSIGMKPGDDIAKQKILQQVAGIENQMRTLKMTKSLSQAEEAGVGKWIDDMASGLEKNFYKDGKLLPELGNFQQLRQTAMDSSMKEYLKVFADYTNQNVIDFAMKHIYPYWSISADTEVLSRDGWKHYWELSEDDELLSLNKDTELTHWDKIQYINIYDYDGEAVNINTGGGDFICTPNHWWLAKKQRQEDWEFIAADQLKDNLRLPKAAFHHYDGESLLTPDEAAILGWVITDGTWNDSTYRMYIQQSKQPYVDEIRELLTRNNCLVSDNTYDGCHQFRISPEYRERLSGVLRDYGIMYVVSHLSQEASGAMWDAMYKAEGRADGNGFTQREGPVLDAFELLSFITGRFVTRLWHSEPDIWYLYPHKSKYMSLRKKGISRVDYHGKMWCPSVEHRTILVRRNNKVCWTGNTYHMYRYTSLLPRTMLRKPGVGVAWGKYNNYADKGYVHIPGTDLEANPFVGSGWGLTFSLTRHDYPSYYENLGPAGEVLDWTMRAGFYPGVHMMAPVVLSPMFSDRPPELGDILPPLGKTALEVMVNSPIKPVSEAAQRLRDKIFHENFRDYYTTTIIDTIQVNAGGKLLDGITGQDLWNKRNREEALSEEEQALWDRASKATGLITILRSMTPGLRLRPAEYLDAYKDVTTIFEEAYGMSPEFQMDLWRHNIRPTDVIGGLDPDVEASLDELWKWKAFLGRGVSLLPPEQGDLYSKMDKFWNTVETYQVKRQSTQRDIDTGFMTPTDALHFDGREWRAKLGEKWNIYGNEFEALKNDPDYADVQQALTVEGQMELARKKGFAAPSRHPMDEVMDLYFSIEPKIKKDKYTGEEETDWQQFYTDRQFIRNALSEEQQVEFDTKIRAYETPLEAKFREISDTYFRGYWATSRIILDTFDEEQKALIAEYYADTTSLDRKEEIQAVTMADGTQLISSWNTQRSEGKARLRDVSPQLDFWLYVFGYISNVRTDEARAMVNKWEQDKTTILTQEW